MKPTATRTTFATITLLTAATTFAGMALARPHDEHAASSDAPHAIDTKQLPAEQAAIHTVAYLGLDTKRLDRDTAKLLGVTPGLGLMASEVLAQSPANAAGLQANDVILKLDDQLLVNPEQLAALVQSREAGETVTLHVMREGEPMTLKAKLGSTTAPPAHDDGHGEVPPADPFAGGRFDPGVDIGLGLRLIGPQPMPDLRVDREQLLVPDDVRNQIEQMRQRMQQQMQERQALIEQMMRQMKMQIENGPMQKLDLGVAQPGIHSTIAWSDGEHTLRLKTDGQGGRWLTVMTAGGKVLFDGEAPEGGKIDGLPEDVQRKIDQMLKNNRIELRFEPELRQPKEKPADIA